MYKWQEFCNSITEIDTIRLPRWVSMDAEANIELHVFADASERAYGAVAYIRVLNTDGTATSNVLTAKSRVAPVKKLKIPRLELLAAKIAAELADFVKRACQLGQTKTFFWTDSSIVLYWLRRDPHTNKPFVANKVADILQLSDNASWRHVSGTINPADLLSRGVTASQLAASTLWWTGDWLALPQAEWPKSTVQSLSPEEKHSVQLEEKNKKVLTISRPRQNVLSVTSVDGSQQTLIDRRSTMGISLRTTALVLRFVSNIRKQQGTSRAAKGKRSRRKQIHLNPPIVAKVTPTELDGALIYWIKAAQREHYHGELEACKHQKPIASGQCCHA